MLRQQRAHCVDAGDGSLAKAARAEVLLHLPAHRLPFGLAHPAGNTPVGDDFARCGPRAAT